MFDATSSFNAGPLPFTVYAIPSISVAQSALVAGDNRHEQSAPKDDLDDVIIGQTCVGTSSRHG